MKGLLTPSGLVAFLIAIVVATVWGAIVQTQYNLAGLNSIGADISSDVRIGATLRDIFSGFSPTYASHIVLPSLLVAFVVAALLPARHRNARVAWFAAAGAVAIALGIPIVNWLAPVALLVGAAREVSSIFAMALGGLLAGWIFASRIYPRTPDPAESEPRRADSEGLPT